MATKDPKQAAEKFVRRAQAATQDMVTGVNNVTVNPAQQAIAKEAKLLNNVTEAITSGKWRRGMQTVTLEAWKEAMTKKGAPRVAAGVQAAQGKMEAFYTQLFPYQEEGLRKLDTMPDMTLEDSINRATAWMRHMANFKRNAR